MFIQHRTVQLCQRTIFCVFAILWHNGKYDSMINFQALLQHTFLYKMAWFLWQEILYFRPCGGHSYMSRLILFQLDPKHFRVEYYSLAYYARGCSFPTTGISNMTHHFKRLYLRWWFTYMIVMFVKSIDQIQFYHKDRCKFDADLDLDLESWTLKKWNVSPSQKRLIPSSIDFS